MPSRPATFAASRESSMLQHPRWPPPGWGAAAGPRRRNTPITWWPDSLRRRAATLESTPPDIAHSTRDMPGMVAHRLSGCDLRLANDGRRTTDKYQEAKKPGTGRDDLSPTSLLTDFGMKP